jgi:hypothetical protein
MCSGALSCTTGRANKRAFPILLPLVHAAVLIGQPVKGVRFDKLGIFSMAGLHQGMQSKESSGKQARPLACG